MERRLGGSMLVVALWALVGSGLSGCGAAQERRAPADAVRVSPADGARGVAAGESLAVTVPDGRLERVVVRREDAESLGGQRGPAERVAGRLSSDGRTWQPTSGQLLLSSRYEIRAEAVDGHGRRTVRRTTFATREPGPRLIGRFTPEDGQTVGTGMIVSLNFNHPVVDRAAVERAVTVSSEPRVPVVGHWFGNRRLDFRPREYWRPGTEVTLDLRLRDVRGARGSYGAQYKKVRFTVGRDQHSLVDADAGTLTVRRGGAHVRTVPITAGPPEFATYNGAMVISEKHTETRMNGATVGLAGEYDYPDVPHAMRLTSSGTFLHGNYWADAGVFGTQNTSHGCVGLEDVRGGSEELPAGWLFRSSLIGDVVEVRGGGGELVSPDNGLSGWNLDWPSWRAGSALDPEGRKKSTWQQ
ncbi:L,D-transpeptidase family protein [Streptomyces sp. P38-E01]|uniref:L,D-transpeptidase family protein n=1 Tax=Streptomyces tardus TaxID=2780544 RepID=A0A949N6D5_9ACTN|nr:Ig-like domain-containing protein [Streptomyces tardus]MBU7596286.1 L,D-transpeptidase family protein [Streptomyces tardus]